RAIVGGGIGGLATARALRERLPGARLVILEKEPRLATHQTGHNSGVIHSGIYYKPGSYKAKLCVEGKTLMYEFCAKHEIRVERCGKVIVATTEAEVPRLMTLHARGIANGVPVELLEPARLSDFEPHARALRAIRSPSTGIVDYGEVAAAMARELQAAGVLIETGARVTAIARTGDGLELATPRVAVRARRLVNCAGLYSDVVARLAGTRPDARLSGILADGAPLLAHRDLRDVPLAQPSGVRAGARTARPRAHHRQPGPGRCGRPRPGREPRRLARRRFPHRRRTRRDPRPQRALSGGHRLARDRPPRRRAGDRGVRPSVAPRRTDRRSSAGFCPRNLSWGGLGG